MRILFIFILLFCNNDLCSQNIADDFERLLAPTQSLSIESINNKELLTGKSQSVIARYNPFSLLAKGAMLGYQHIVSPQFGNRCNYAMSCSNFAKQSIATFGLLKGVFLAADRVSRCNRLAYMDINPIRINRKTYQIDDYPTYYKNHD